MASNADLLLPLTFGIEVEHLLAFHESLLKPHLPPNTSIVKHIPKETRVKLNQVARNYTSTRSYYLGWALSSPSAYPSSFDRENYGWRNEQLHQFGFRGYADEVLRIEQQILNSHGKEALMHDNYGKMRTFEKWHLALDNSLISAPREKLKSELGNMIKKGEEEEWDSAPLELVSRVLPLEERSFEEVESFLNALNVNQKQHKAFTDQWCGLHVHIGLPLLPPSISCSSAPLDLSQIGLKRQLDGTLIENQQLPTFPLPLLQHFAYMLTIHEPTISLLHPPSRRNHSDLVSNRDRFIEHDYGQIDWDAVQEPVTKKKKLDKNRLNVNVNINFDSGYDSSTSLISPRYNDETQSDDDDDDDDDDDCDSESDSDASEAAITMPFEDLPKKHKLLDDETAGLTAEEIAAREETALRSRAARKIFAKDTSVQSLVELMCSGSRSRVVNWLNLAPPLSASAGLRQIHTIEFRQHEGCVDPVEVGRWVRFVAGLVRWAERMSRELDLREGGWEAEGVLEGLLRARYGGVEGEVEAMRRVVGGVGFTGEDAEWVWRRMEMWR